MKVLNKYLLNKITGGQCSCFILHNGSIPIPTVIDSIDLEYICKYVCCNKTGEAYYRFGWSNVVHKCFDNQRDFPGMLDSEQLSSESRFLVARGAILGKMLDAQ